MSNGFICFMGIGTVFVGLICIIILCTIMSTVCKMFAKPGKKPVQASAPSSQAAVKSDVPVENKQEIIAGVCAVIAEELGTEVNNIRVTSFKRI